MDVEIDKAFDIVKINMREADPGQVGLHIWKAGIECTYLTMPRTMLSGPMWQEIKLRAEIAWAVQPLQGQPVCAVCGGLIRLNRRSWRGREFCVLCGSTL
jgi:hypothetical protein